VSNVDYVVVGPGPSLADVRIAVQRATDSRPGDDGWLNPPDERAALNVIADGDVDGGTVVLVHYAGDPLARRHELARSIYDELVATTDWDLTHDSDDAEDILASRSSQVLRGPL
jgi:hypothetical protein